MVQEIGDRREPPNDMAKDDRPSGTITRLRELLDALDRRHPHPDDPLEPRIAEQAAALRNDAEDAIRKLEILLAERDRGTTSAKRVSDDVPAADDDPLKADAPDGVGRS
jgi:hypothetical protein